MKKEILTPTHPHWMEFVITLSMGLNLREENGKEKWDCNGDLSKATKILESIKGIDIPATIDYFQSNGCCCDCKVLLNLDTISEEDKNFEIGYRLDYFPPHGSLHTTVISTIRKLPKDVREFALENCFFFSMEEGVYGRIISGAHGSNMRWKLLERLTDKEKLRMLDDFQHSWKIMILLRSETPENDIESVIAHEIAHAYLGHNEMDEIEVEEREIEGLMVPVNIVEYEAYKQTLTWGFEGSGADIEKSALSEDVMSCLKGEG